MILVDTSIWIEFFRSRSSEHRLELASLLRANEVLIGGVVIAEVLQGAQSEQEFTSIRDQLVVLPYIEEAQETWAAVGALSYQLRQRGVTVGLIDLLIATLALENDAEVYTLDEHFQLVPGLRLHGVAAA